MGARRWNWIKEAAWQPGSDSNEANADVLMNPGPSSDLTMGPYHKHTPNPNVVYGQMDMDNQRTTYNRIGTRWGDAQMHNGWDNTNWGRRLKYGTQGFMNEVVPIIPGQMRLLPSGFVGQGPAPSQWQKNVDAGPGAQPFTPGGPGQLQGLSLYNPGTGG